MLNVSSEELAHFDNAAQLGQELKLRIAERRFLLFSMVFGISMIYWIWI